MFYLIFTIHAKQKSCLGGDEANSFGPELKGKTQRIENNSDWNCMRVSDIVGSQKSDQWEIISLLIKSKVILSNKRGLTLLTHTGQVRLFTESYPPPQPSFLLQLLLVQFNLCLK